jgi:MFS family permease
MANVATDPLAHIPAWRCGAAGGAIAALGQFIGTTLLETWDHFIAGETRAGLAQVGAFVIGAILMAVAGSVVAFFLQAKTQNRWALFLAGAAATSIATTALPGLAKLAKRVEISPISTAYAQAADGGCKVDFGYSVGDGLKQFFGLDDSGYHVVVGSFKRYSDAQALVSKINSEDSSLKAAVGDKAPCNDYYAVIVGPTASTLDEAKKIQSKVLKLDSVPAAYISKRTN